MKFGRIAAFYHAVFLRRLIDYFLRLNQEALRYRNPESFGCLAVTQDGKCGSDLNYVAGLFKTLT